MQCTVCGGTTFSRRPVLWDALVAQWQITREEADYIDRQQGEACAGCGANLRSIALAGAILGVLGAGSRTLQDASRVKMAAGLRILELNEAGTLTPTLREFDGYSFGKYPEIDMHALPYADNSFDLIIHSDTLEHVPRPVHGLEECRRVLKPAGALCFTVPIIVGRMTRDRTGLPKSYHGDAATATDDYVVQTEFGADAWTFIMRAGFRRVTTHAVEFPAAIAFAAYKN